MDRASNDRQILGPTDLEVPNVTTNEGANAPDGAHQKPSITLCVRGVPSSAAVAGHDRSERRERLDLPHAFGCVMSFMPKPLSTYTNPSLVSTRNTWLTRRAR